MIEGGPNQVVKTKQIRGTNLDPRAKEKVERLLRTVLSLVELLQRKNTSIKKLREMIFGKRTERHQARKTEGREKVDESEKSDDGQPKAVGDQDARAELRAIGSEDKPKPGSRTIRLYALQSIMKRIVCAGLGWRLGSYQAHCSRALRIQLIELNRGGGYGV
jgi:hypothetical protein